MIALKDQAIQTALLGDWETAIALNKRLLKENPTDIETLNRLAFALAARQKIKEAKSIYLKVLRIDEQNQIAIKNLQKLKTEKNWSASTHAIIQNPTVFLEETGKTKIIELVNIAQPNTIAHLHSGEPILLVIKRSKIFVLDTNKTFIGMLPDNISTRLIKFMTGGNLYEAFIKSVDRHRVVIFIREIKRATRFKHHPSFVTSTEKGQFVLDGGKSKKTADHSTLVSEEPEDEF